MYLIVLLQNFSASATLPRFPLAGVAFLSHPSVVSLSPRYFGQLPIYLDNVFIYNVQSRSAPSFTVTATLFPSPFLLLASHCFLPLVAQISKIQRCAYTRAG
mmetsp:Transcript_10499/g.27495  ORF Transcript_10499/g.27495 Transcript_10499/m.27495 type:complete len:102 (-) Transcript_10499:813-1118(-)